MRSTVRTTPWASGPTGPSRIGASAEGGSTASCPPAPTACARSKTNGAVAVSGMMPRAAAAPLQTRTAKRPLSPAKHAERSRGSVAVIVSKLHCHVPSGHRRQLRVMPVQVCPVSGLRISTDRIEVARPEGSVSGTPTPISQLPSRLRTQKAEALPGSTPPRSPMSLTRGFGISGSSLARLVRRHGGCGVLGPFDDGASGIGQILEKSGTPVRRSHPGAPDGRILADCFWPNGSGCVSLHRHTASKRPQS